MDNQRTFNKGIVGLKQLDTSLPLEQPWLHLRGSYLLLCIDVSCRRVSIAGNRRCILWLPSGKHP